MSSVNTETVEGVAAANNLINAIATGENVNNVATSSNSFSISNIGNSVQISATLGAALKLFSDTIGGATGLGGLGLTAYADLNEAVASYHDNNGIISSSIWINLGSDFYELIAGGLLTGIAAAEASGLSTVIIAGVGTIALPEALALAATAGTVAVILGGAGLISQGLSDGINAA